jgi:hypothetical protein
MCTALVRYFLFALLCCLPVKALRAQTLTVVNPLDFGKILLTSSSGWIRIPPQGTPVTSNVVTYGSQASGNITITRLPNRALTVQFLPSSLVVTKGTSTMTASSFTQQLVTVNNRTVRLFVGGTLSYGKAGLAGGNYAAKTPLMVVVNYQ